MYTKGEWKAGFNPGVTGPTTPAVTTVCGGRDWPYRTVNVGTETIAICPAQDTDRTHQPNIDEAVANTHLIASAPDLYEACKALIEFYTTPKGETGRFYLADVVRQTQKALAKAKS